MKKKVLISLSIIMALCLTACSGGTAPANTSSNTSAIDTSAEDFTEDDTEAAPEDDIDEEAETIAADETENSDYMKQRGVAGDYDGTELNLVMEFLIRDGYCATVTVQAETEEKINQLISLFVPIQ